MQTIFRSGWGTIYELFSVKYLKYIIYLIYHIRYLINEKDLVGTLG